jgi:hypothetical protein
MAINNEEYKNVKTLLKKTLDSLLNENIQNKEKILKDTRFEIKNKATADEVMRKVDVYGKEDYYQLRRKWSMYIFASLAGTLLFQYFIA